METRDRTTIGRTTRMTISLVLFGLSTPSAGALQAPFLPSLRVADEAPVSRDSYASREAEPRAASGRHFHLSASRTIWPFRRIDVRPGPRSGQGDGRTRRGAIPDEE